MLGRRIPFNQIAFATVVGVAGGVYIYRPMFEPPKKPADEELKSEPEEQKADRSAGAPEAQPDAHAHRD